MKKLFALGMASVMALSLAACGGSASSAASGAADTSSAATAEATGKKWVVATDTVFKPFEYTDASGNFVGIDVDILAAIAEDQGFEYTIDNCGWDAALSSLGAGQADGMIAGMTITDERKESYDFSDPYFEGGQIMFVKGDSSITSIEDLSGKTVAVKAGTESEKYAQSVADEYGFTIVSYKDSPTVYTAVTNGNDAAGFEDMQIMASNSLDEFSVINYQIAAQDLDLKTVGDKVQIGNYGFAVLKGSNPELIEMFNAGLANIQANGVYDEILANYGIEG